MSNSGGDSLQMDDGALMNNARTGVLVNSDATLAIYWKEASGWML